MEISTSPSRRSPLLNGQSAHFFPAGFRAGVHLFCGLLLVVVLGLAGCAAEKGISRFKSERFSFPNAPYIFHLASFGSIHDINPPSPFLQWVLGEVPGENAQVVRPYGIAATKGKVYINDGRGSSGYWVFDLVKDTFKLIQHPSLQGSTGIAVDERDFKYLAIPRLQEAKARGTLNTDKETGAIVVFDHNNRGVQEAVFPGRPIGIAVWNNRLFVTDAIHHRVVVLDKSTLKVVHTFGKVGEGDADFRFPKGISVGRKGRIYVGDTFNGRIKVFNQEGEVISRFGNRARVLGAFVNLSDLSVDKAGRVYAVDAGASQKILNEEVQVFDSSKFYLKGEKVAAVDASQKERKKAVFGFFQKPNGIGKPGKSGAAISPLYRPTGITVDYQNIAYFKDAFPPESKFKIEYLIWLTTEGAYNGRNISVFAFLSKK